jgi:hypothetical protein
VAGGGYVERPEDPVTQERDFSDVAGDEEDDVEGIGARVTLASGALSATGSPTRSSSARPQHH